MPSSENHSSVRREIRCQESFFLQQFSHFIDSYGIGFGNGFLCEINIVCCLYSAHEAMNAISAARGFEFN